MRQFEDIEIFYAFHFAFLPKNEHETRARLLPRSLEFSKRRNDRLLVFKVPDLLTVSFASVPNPHHLYYFGSIVNFVDDAIVAYTNTPIATGPCNFLASSRSWVLGKCLQMGDDSFVNSPRKGL